MEANVYRAAPAGQRFFVSMPRLKPWLKGVLVLALLAAVAVALNLVPGKFVLLVLLGFCGGLFLVIGSGRKRAPIDVGPGGLAIDGGRRGTFGVAGAKFGRWNHPH